MRSLVKIFFWLLCSLPLALQAVSHYYPTEYQRAFDQKIYKGTKLRHKLFVLLSYCHVRVVNGNDRLALDCDLLPKELPSYEHRVLTYMKARRALFGELHLDKDAQGYFINDVYCRKKITAKQTQIGPKVIPNIQIINCEHSWPQSKFTEAFPQNLQRSDLHHLYPVDSRANSTRGNRDFSNIDNTGQEVIDCDASYRSRDAFEPPDEHKGNVARAMFYFSIRYKKRILKEQEETLRSWHILDPVDSEERERNEKIHYIQGNRNPFIDYPRLVSLIEDF